jgi:integrase
MPGFFISYIDERGKRHQRFGGHTRSQASTERNAERERIRKAKQAIAKGVPIPTEDTFATLATRYLTFQRNRCKAAQISVEDLRRQETIFVGHLVPFFGQMKLAAIRPAHIRGYIEFRTGAAAAATIVKECSAVKHFLGVACDHWELIATNPARKVKLPELPEGRTRHLVPAELGELLVACPTWLRPIVGLAVSTGARRGELMRIRWQDVDMERGRILLLLTKNGQRRFIYLNQLSRQVLAGLERGQPKDLLFPGVTLARVSVAFVRACKAAGILDFSFHDLRHTFASQLRMNGADLHTVGQLLGHKDLRMTSRYSHLSPEFLGAAASKLDDVFTGKLTLGAGEGE